MEHVPHYNTLVTLRLSKKDEDILFFLSENRLFLNYGFSVKVKCRKEISLINDHITGLRALLYFGRSTLLFWGHVRLRLQSFYKSQTRPEYC